jgi:hypothetical protein
MAKFLSQFEYDNPAPVRAGIPEADHPLIGLSEAVELPPASITPANQSEIGLAGGLGVRRSLCWVMLAPAKPALQSIGEPMNRLTPANEERSGGPLRSRTPTPAGPESSRGLSKRP